MDDLSECGLLDETLVVVIGEFGRTPKINVNGGRDHWGHVFSFAMAGAGIRGGQVIGASDKDGAYPATPPITGGDLTATIFHLLGIDPAGVFHDKENRPHPLTKGEPIARMLGERLTTGLRLSHMDTYDLEPETHPPLSVYNWDCHALNCHVFKDARWGFRGVLWKRRSVAVVLQRIKPGAAFDWNACLATPPAASQAWGAGLAMVFIYTFMLGSVRRRLDSSID